MKLDLGDAGKPIGNELYRLGFRNHTDILNSADELPNPAFPPLEEYRRIQMIDPSSNANGITFKFKASQHTSERPWSLYHISASLPYLANDGQKTSKVIVKGYLTNEPFPKKEATTKDLLAALQLERTKEDLKNNEGLKKELERIGFLNVEELITGATQFFGWTHLHGSVDVDERIGTGMDRVDFLIKLSHPENYGSFDIVKIVATLDSPGGVSHGEPGPTSIAYNGLQEKLPKVDKMVNDIIKEERQRFKAYANAYRLVKDLKAKKDAQQKLGGRKKRW